MRMFPSLDVFAIFYATICNFYLTQAASGSFIGITPHSLPFPLPIPMNTLRASHLGLSFAGLLLASAALADSTWNGVDGEYTTAGNWTPSGVPVLTSGATATINAGNVTYTPGGDLFITNGSTLQISGGSFTQAGGIAFMQMAGGNLLVNGGSFNQGTSGAIVRNASSSITVSSGSATFNGAFVNNGSLTLSGGTTSIGGQFGSETTGVFSISAGLLTVQNNFVVTTGTVNINGGTVNIGGELKSLGADFTISGGTVTALLISFDATAASFDISGGSLVLSGNFTDGIFANSPDAYLNFTTGSTGELKLTSVSATGAANLLASRVRFNDTIDAGAFEIVADGAGSIVRLIPSSVPEPSSYAMLAGLGVIGFVSLRRRRRD
jgi:hypothetical protein